MAGNSNSGGRNAKSTQDHRLQGTDRQDRHGSYDTPEPPVGKPPVPDGLGGFALAEWGRMVTRLETTKTLSTVDDAVLYQYCMLFSETEQIVVDSEANRKLCLKLQRLAQKLRGDDLVNAIEHIVKLQYLVNNATKMLRQQRMALRQYLVEFGQTPAARTRVKIRKSEDKPKGKLFEFMQGGKADPATS